MLDDPQHGGDSIKLRRMNFEPAGHPARRLTRLLVAALSLASCFCASQAVRAEVTRGYVSEARAPVAPGAFHDHGSIEVDAQPGRPAGRQVVHLLEVDTHQPVITFEASLSNDRVAGLERTTSQANRKNEEGHRVVGATNADFYDTGGTAAPTGIHIQWNELAKANELVTFGTNARPTFGVLPDGSPILGSPRVTASVTAPNGVRSIARLNQARAAEQLVLYTSRFAARTGTNSFGTEVVVTGVALPLGAQDTYEGTVSQVRIEAGDTEIGANEVVLSGHGVAAGFLSQLREGNSVVLSLSISTGWAEVIHAVGGSHFIVRNGEVVPAANDGFSNVVHPRTAIGITAERGVVMATVDGRQPGYSIGVRLDELGELLHSRGAVEAINLDGGGSTTMAARLPGEDGVTLVSRPSDPPNAQGVRERTVSNSILVVSSAPTGPLAIANVMPIGVTAFVGTEVDYIVKGQDAAYNAVPVEPGSIKWSDSGPAGKIDDSGRFRSRKAGTSTIKAKIGRVKGETDITVVDTLSDLEVRPSYATLDIGETQAFTSVARSDGTEVRVGPGLVAWEVVGSIGSIDAGGVFTGQARGGGSVRAAAGGATGSARVDVDRPPEILEDFEDISDMRALAVAGTAELTSAMSPDPVQSGTRSARLAYNFNAPGTSAAYASHAVPPSAPTYREIDALPKRIGIWVYGDGSRHWLRGHYREGTGQAQQVVSFTPSPSGGPTRPCRERTGGIDWVGWKLVEAEIPANAQLPLKWERVYVVETEDRCDDSGQVFFDDLRAVYSSAEE